MQNYSKIHKDKRGGGIVSSFVLGTIGILATIINGSKGAYKGETVINIDSF